MAELGWAVVDTAESPRALLCSGLLLLLLAAPLLAQPGYDLLLARVLQDPSHKVRLQAAIKLGRCPGPRSAEALLRALDDPHAAVRASAAISLGRLGNPSSRGALIAATLDPEWLVSRAARQALELLAATKPPGSQPQRPRSFLQAAQEQRMSLSGPGLASNRSPAERTRILRRLDEPLQRCGLRQLKRDPGFRGASLRFTVKPEGSITGLEIRNPTMPRGRFRRCVQKALDELHLEPAGGGELSFILPLRLSD